MRPFRTRSSGALGVVAGTSLVLAMAGCNVEQS